MIISKVSDIILGTGSYEKVQSGNTVSITGDGGCAWGYYGPTYKKLAPRLITYNSYAQKLEELNNLKRNISDLKLYYEYREKMENDYIKSYYETRLKNLNINELLETFEQKFGKQIILLCHESNYEFCHRRVLADYIELKTGIYIPEISTDLYGNINKLNPIRYKKRLKKYL